MMLSQLFLIACLAAPPGSPVGQIIVMPDGMQIKTIGEARWRFRRLVWSWDGPGDLGEKHTQNTWNLADLDIRKTAEANGYDWRTDDWYKTFRFTARPKKWDK